MFTFNKRFLFGAFYLVLAGCTNLKGVSPISSSSTNTNNSSTQFSQAFKTNLISAGLSLDNADFLSVSSPVDLQPMSVKLIFEKIFGSSFHEVSIDSMSKALRAVSDEAHFSSVAEKQTAIEAISEAHLKTVKSLASPEELSLILSDVAKIVGSEFKTRDLLVMT